MRVLALDTTTPVLSAAVVEHDRILAEHVDSSARSHAERLPGDLLAALEACDVPLSAIEIFAVAAGPGSFTGLRIGIATMQGLAFVNRRRMVAVSALDALAHAAACEARAGDVIGVWIDAHRRQVFSALYRVAEAPPDVIEIEAAAVGTPAATRDRWQADGVSPSLLIGDGAVVYGSISRGPGRIIPGPPLAPVIGRVAAMRASRGETIDPAAVQPLYVRRPDAEIARDKLCG